MAVFSVEVQSFNVCSTVLRMFYEKVTDTNRLDKLIRAGSVLGGAAPPL